MNIFYILAIWAIVYRLREVPHIWSKSTTYRLRWKWMARSKWWTDSSPKSNWLTDILGINTFNDAYHFFANLPRIVYGIWIGFEYGWIAGLVGFVVYWIFTNIAADFLIVKVRK